MRVSVVNYCPKATELERGGYRLGEVEHVAHDEAVHPQRRVERVERSSCTRPKVSFLESLEL